MKPTVTFLTALLLSPLSALHALHALHAADNDAAMLHRVAEHVLQKTSRTLIDRNGGETFTDSTGLAPKPEISIESKFNAWFYETWLLADGMRRTSEALDEPRYRTYGEQNLEFIFRYMDYLQRQRDAHMAAAPVGDCPLSPIGFYFQINSLWQTGLAPLAVERFEATKDSRYEPFLGRMRNFLEECPRFDEGAFYRKGKGMMTDDPYMTVPFLVREWQQTGEAQHLDHPVSWLETSATGMLTYGIARGVNEGWLDASFADTARKGWSALQSKVTPEGDLTDVCGSTDTGDLAFYLKRPRLQGDLHGFGSYLLAGAEIVRMQKNNLPK